MFFFEKKNQKTFAFSVADGYAIWPDGYSAASACGAA
jgi:hypothetical protein